MKRIFIFLCLVLLITGNAWGASVDGTVNQKLTDAGGVHRLRITWTAGDTASGETGNVEFLTREVNGLILGFQTNPDGTEAPTDNYDIVLVDAESGRKICYDSGSGETTAGDGILANRDTSNTEYVPMQTSTGVPCAIPHLGGMTVYAFHAGETNAGVLDIFFISD